MTIAEAKERLKKTRWRLSCFCMRRPSLNCIGQCSVWLISSCGGEGLKFHSHSVQNSFWNVEIGKLAAKRLLLEGALKAISGQ